MKDCAVQQLVKARASKRRNGSRGTLPEFLQRVGLLFSASPASPAEFGSSPTPTPTPPGLAFRKWNKCGPTSSLRAGGRCCSSRHWHLRHQILWNVFHVRLHQCWVQRLVVLQEFEIIRVVLKMSLQVTTIR